MTPSNRKPEPATRTSISSRLSARAEWLCQCSGPQLIHTPPGFRTRRMVATYFGGCGGGGDGGGGGVRQHGAAGEGLEAPSYVELNQTRNWREYNKSPYLRRTKQKNKPPPRSTVQPRTWAATSPAQRWELYRRRNWSPRRQKCYRKALPSRRTSPRTLRPES